MYSKIYNSDVVDFKLAITVGDESVRLVIPSAGYAIVSTRVAVEIQNLYATLEITESNLKEYQAYRKLKQKADKEAKKLAEEKVEVDLKEAKAEAKRNKKSLKARHEDELLAVEKAKEEKIATINTEKEVIAELGKTTVNVVDPKEEEKEEEEEEEKPKEEEKEEEEEEEKPKEEEKVVEKTKDKKDK